MNRRQFRAGFSLLETIVALAIFVGAIAILNELLQIGLLANESHARQSAGLLLAESKMSELEAGIEPIRSSDEPAPIPDAPGWSWRVEASPAAAPGERSSESTPGLVHVRLRVEYRPDEAEEPKDFIELQRWMVVPARRLQNLSRPAEVENPAKPESENPEAPFR